jgi:hypothetical protein
VRDRRGRLRDGVRRATRRDDTDRRCLGAIYGLILAYGSVFAERRILWNLLFPIKARTFAWIFFAIAFVSSVTQPGDGVSHLAHLGGMVVGWLYMKRAWRVRPALPRDRLACSTAALQGHAPKDTDRWVH